MNNIFYIFMDAYKSYLLRPIYTIIESHIKNDPNFVINRNEEGKIHSHYLRDRYEPAIIKYCKFYEYHYYLFDGDIKDCIHPFCVSYRNGKIIDVKYYSSERIKNGEPNYIDNITSYYNTFDGPILNGYESKQVDNPNNLKEFTLLFDEMEKPFAFKFAD